MVVLTNFRTAKAVLAVVAFIGWACAVIGLTGAAMMLAEGEDLAVLIGLALLLTGLVIVAMAQMGRALIATAEATERMLGEMQARARDRG